jgi:hypothetical protein
MKVVLQGKRRRNAMKPSEGRRRPSQFILRLFPALVISSIVMAVGMSARTSVVDKQRQPAVVLTGIVSDTTCGSGHGTGVRGDPECTRTCVELGAGYALAVGKKVYMLQGHQAKLDRFAGEPVLVKGRIVSRDTVAVESVAPVVADALHGG